MDEVNRLQEITTKSCYSWFDSLSENYDRDEWESPQTQRRN